MLNNSTVILQVEKLFRRHIAAIKWLSEPTDVQKEAEAPDASACVTCTLVSVLNRSDDSEFHQMILLTKQHSPSVLNYQHCGNLYMVRITTIHTKKTRKFSRLINLIKDHANFPIATKVKPDATLPTHLVLHKLDQLWSAKMFDRILLKKLRVKPEKTSSILTYCSGPVQMRVHSNPWIAEFVFNGEDSVSGYLSDQSSHVSVFNRNFCIIVFILLLSLSSQNLYCNY